MLASAGGYALFWVAMFRFPSRWQRFLFTVFWYIGVEAVHLSWMTSMQYMGPLILIVYILLLIGLGVQFGLFSCFLSPNKQMSQLQCVGLAGCWVLLEWMRIYFLTGFTWNPIGLALTEGRFSIQMATLFGIYGLSFWVIWTNLAGLRAWFFDRSVKNQCIWGALVLFPYGFGMVHQAWVEGCFEEKGHLRAALVETGLFVEEKYYDRNLWEAFVPAAEQWERVWNVLGNGKLDLIILPENAFPFGAHRPFCWLEEIEEKWKKRYGEHADADFPPLRAPFAIPYEWKGGIHWRITNAFLAQSLANHYQAAVIIGLNAEDRDGKYNAAFQFSPGNMDPQRCEKRILAPVGEYVPCKGVHWIAKGIAKEFGIEDSFDAGQTAKIFSAKVPIGVAICLEEIYSDCVRQLRRKGAELLVSLSNDVWFPFSKLAKQHFDHGRIRAVENGVFLLRSTNMGITGAVDCFGQPIACLDQSNRQAEAAFVSIPVFSYPTLYSFWGDAGIISLSSFCCFLCAVSAVRRKSCP